eukprot:m.51523 g.51523  ORF g.51523 m.51523 type:complete len:467 (+) comp11241_c1_seq1:205-1605(+)
MAHFFLVFHSTSLNYLATMSAFDNVDAQFAASITGSTMSRWQRKEMQASASQGDRFIPERSAMNMEASHYKLVNGESGAEATCSPSKVEYTRAMRQNLMHSEDSKILAFKQKAPTPKEGFASDLRVLYTQNRAAQRTKKSTRMIPQAPDRILDAPELRADYYLNLIDWSAQNTVAVALDTTVYLWDASSGSITELCSVGNPGDYISSVSWAADGTHLAVGTHDSAVQIWDVTAQRKLREMTGHEARVGAMDWNEHILSSGSQTGHIINSDVRVQQHAVSHLRGHSSEVCGLKWSPDGRLLASGGNDNVLNIWTGEGELKHRLTEHQAAVKALAWCPWQNNLLASGGGTADRHIRFWNSSTGNCVNAIDTKSQVCSLLWSKEHKEIISGHGFSNNQLTIWKYPTLNKVAELTGHTERVLSMAMSPDGQTVVSAAGDETLRFWTCFAADAKKKSKKTTTSSIVNAQLR